MRVYVHVAISAPELEGYRTSLASRRVDVLATPEACEREPKPERSVLSTEHRRGRASTPLFQGRDLVMAANRSSPTAAVVDDAVTCCKAIMIMSMSMLIPVASVVTLLTIVGLAYFAAKLTECDFSCDEDAPGASRVGGGDILCDGANSMHLLIIIKYST